MPPHRARAKALLRVQQAPSNPDYSFLAIHFECSPGPVPGEFFLFVNFKTVGRLYGCGTYFCAASLLVNMFYLADIQSTPAQYLPVAIQLLFAIGFVAVMIGASHLLGPKRKTADKLENFESGIEQIGNARQPMAVKYFLVAILFVLFDVEVIFFYPYAVNFKALGMQGFLAVLMFVGFFLAGFIYIVKKGALKWDD
jgi:NADH-quinone oxidoreductase subunit A